MYCTNCSKQISDESKYCSYCGSEINNSIQNYSSRYETSPYLIERSLVKSRLLTFLTYGIYSWYWSYMMGKKLYESGRKYDLNIFGFDSVNYALIQDSLNKFAD